MGDFPNPLFGSQLSNIYQQQYMQCALQQQQASLYNLYNTGCLNTTITAPWSLEAQRQMQAPQKQARAKSDNEKWLDRRVNEMRVVLF